jgi:F0F1-type ATP synthase membrane subunit b/b'
MSSEEEVSRYSFLTIAIFLGVLIAAIILLWVTYKVVTSPAFAG